MREELGACLTLSTHNSWTSLIWLIGSLSSTTLLYSEESFVVGIDGSAYDLTSIFGRRNLWRCYSSRLCPLNLGTLIEHVGKSTMIMFITQLICSPALDFDIFDEIVSFCFVSYLYLYIYAMATIASAINKILRCQHYPDSVHQGYKSKNVKSACQLIIAVYAIRGHQGLVNAVS